ncbi:C-terminal domain of CHU protein family protein [Chitinophaga sp. YR627]|uniref:Ig-like domain-containing protein n=1 Tax=Chitinophaga sp. YR627 TaxID=1881041 RepID=UPI0008E3B5B3|nr:PKD domain-containing protein [Chitinophaga sp. YR627]SFM61333.1 C-terminal domain of CHU protein family protein [Chitinophaga sp. YR627]
MRLFAPVFRLSHNNVNLCILFNVFLFVSQYAFGQTPPPPAITSFTPANVCQGQTVTITGTNFQNATAVRVGTDNAVSFTVNSPTSITAVVSYSAQTERITVTTPGGSDNSNTSLTIRAAPRPALRDVSTKDVEFSNCDGSQTYLLRIRNLSYTPETTGNNYTISWGDGTPAFTQQDWPSGAEISHNYGSQGYFLISISITPPNGCTQTKQYQFYNGKNPLASLSTSTSTTGLCVPAPIEFQIGNWTGNTPGTTYELDFGDNSPHLILQHPLNTTLTTHLVSHTYTTSSCPAVDFTATLKVSNGCFTTTYTLNQIIIRKKPVADFRTEPVLCINTPVCFTNLTEDGYGGTSCNRNTNFLWDFGDGTTSTDRTPPCHTYARPGTYNVKLSATNSACGDDIKIKQVTVLDVSPPPTVAAGPATYCQGDPATQLTATGTNLLWYNFSTGGTGSTTAPTPSTSRPGTFNYYVTQTLPNRCESPRAVITVIVNARPPAPAVNSPVQLCRNQTATPLTASGSGLLWYTNSTGGTGTATAPTPVTTAAGTTTWYVSQTTNGCEGPRAAIELIVSELAGAPTVTSPVSYCQNQSAIPLTAGGTSLRWYTLPTGGTGSPVAPVPSTATPGSTTYYVSQITGCGESPRAAIVVNVTASPSASIAYSPAILCNAPNTPAAPNPVVHVTRTGAGGGNFSVIPAAGLTIDAATGDITPAGASPGTYTIRYTISGTAPCPDYVTTTTVTINSTPSATIAYPAMCSSDGVTGVQLTGANGGSFSSTTGLSLSASTGAITPGTSTPGTYTVTYTIPPSPPCAGFSTSTRVTITRAPAATISYQPAVLCNVSSGTPNPPVTPVITGNTGGTFSITPATGLTINPGTGTITPAGATPGIYTISYTVNGTGGCALFSTSATVTVNSTPAATIRYANSPYCGSTSTPQTVTFSGTPGGTFSAGTGLSINPTTGAIDPSQSTPGNYTVQYAIAAAPPCPGFNTTASVTITEQPVISFPVTTQAICSGGSATFRPRSTVANTTYNWSVTGTLPAGVAGISAGSVNGTNAAINLSFTNTGNVSQTLTIRVSPVNPTPSPCTGADYNLQLTVKPVTAAPVTDTAHFCMGMPSTSLQVTPSPGNTINWYDASQNPLNSAPLIRTTTAATYRFYVSQTNAEGCESPKAPVVAVVHPTLKITSATATNPVRCGIPSGTIALHVLDLNNGAVPNMDVIVHYNKFQIPYSYSTRTDANGNISVPLTAGTYSQIYVETVGNCLAQKIPDVFILRDPSPPAQPVAGYNPPLCAGATLTLTALSATSEETGPVEYIWAGPAFGPFSDTSRNTVVTFPSVSTSDAGTYAVYAMQNNCISLPAEFEVKITQGPTQPLISTRSPLCVGDDLLLQAYSSISGNSALTYLWKGPGAGLPVSTANVTINNVQISNSGIYTITVTSTETGCSASADTLIQVGAYPVVTLPQDTVSLPTGHLLPLTTTITNADDPGVLPITQYKWTPVQNLRCNDALCSAPVATIKNDICYQVEVTNAYGCAAKDEICIKVFCQESQVFIPNAFAPGGDIPENRRLVVRATGINAVKSFRVFNRWGRIMYERSNFAPNDPAFGWDGLINGKRADTGVYVYTVEVVCENGVPYTFKGNVTLF